MNQMISDADYRALEKTTRQSGWDKTLLAKITRSRKVVSEELLPKKTVKLNSLVLLWHSFLKKVVRFRIVLPHKEDMGNKNISVFAPISMAIFGYKENDNINVTIGGIKKELRIIKVVNK